MTMKMTTVMPGRLLLIHFLAAATLFVLAAAAMSGLAQAQSPAENAVQFARLSPELNQQDPLFHVVAAGVPKGAFIGLLWIRQNSCILEVISARNNKAVFTLADHVTCATDFEFEDGFAIANALQFREFTQRHAKTIKAVLARYQIDYKTAAEVAALPRQKDRPQRQCIAFAQLRVCKGKQLRISMMPIP